MRGNVWHNMSVSSFTVGALTKMFPDAVERTYNAGQIVIYHGDKPDYVMFVISGTVKFYDIDSDGNEKIFHIGGPQSFFPLFYTFEGKDHVDAFYTTLEKSRFLLIPLSDFRKRIEEDAPFTAAILAWYAKEMDYVVLRLKSLERSSARQKLLQALSYLCEQHSVGKPWHSSVWCRVRFPLSQQTLAELTGMTRETVNATLKDIQKLGVIRVPKKMTLEIHKEKLEALMHTAL